MYLILCFIISYLHCEVNWPAQSKYQSIHPKDYNFFGKNVNISKSNVSSKAKTLLNRSELILLWEKLISLNSKISISLSKGFRKLLEKQKLNASNLINLLNLSFCYFWYLFIFILRLFESPRKNKSVTLWVFPSFVWSCRFPFVIEFIWKLWLWFLFLWMQKWTTFFVIVFVFNIFVFGCRFHPGTQSRKQRQCLFQKTAILFAELNTFSLLRSCGFLWFFFIFRLNRDPKSPFSIFYLIRYWMLSR